MSEASPNLFCPGCGYALDGWLSPDPQVAALAKELIPLIDQMENSLRYIGAVKYLDLCRQMRAALEGEGR